MSSEVIGNSNDGTNFPQGRLSQSSGIPTHNLLVRKHENTGTSKYWIGIQRSSLSS